MQWPKLIGKRSMRTGGFSFMTRIQGMMILLSAGLWLSPVWAQPASELVQLAIQASSAQDWAKAADLYQKAIRLEPNNAGLYNNLGVALRRKGDLKGAATAYQKALDLDPGLDTAYLNLTIALLSGQQWAEAVATVQKAKPQLPGDPDLFLYEGLAYEKLQQWVKAVQAYESYVQRSPDALGYYRLAISHWQVGDGSRAAEAFRRAARLDPSVGIYSSEAGRALAKLGINEEAATLLRRLPQDWPDPTDFTVLARLAYQLNELGVAETAVQTAFQKADTSLSDSPESIQNNSQVSAALLNDAGVLKSSTDPAIATRYLQAAAAKVDGGQGSIRTGAIAYTNLGEVYLAQEQLDLALAAAQEAVQRDPTLPQAQNTLGVAWLRLERLPEAKAALQKATQLDPNYWQAYRNLAVAQASEGALIEASQTLQMAIDKAPSLDVARNLNQELIQLQQATAP